MKKTAVMKDFVLALFVVLTFVLFTACNGASIGNGPYRVVFDLQGGTGAAPVQLVESGEKAARPAVDPVYEGFIFTGWSDVADTYAAFDFDKAILVDTTVYAFWSLPAPEIFEVEGNSYKWRCEVDVTEMMLDGAEFNVRLNETLGTAELLLDGEVDSSFKYTYNPVTKELLFYTEVEEGPIEINATGFLDGNIMTLFLDGENDMVLKIVLVLKVGSGNTYECVGMIMYMGIDFVIEFEADGTVIMDFIVTDVIQDTITGVYVVEENQVEITATDNGGNANIIYFTISDNSTVLTLDFSKGELPLLEWIEDVIGLEIESMIFTKIVS